MGISETPWDKVFIITVVVIIVLVILCHCNFILAICGPCCNLICDASCGSKVTCCMLLFYLIGGIFALWHYGVIQPLLNTICVYAFLISFILVFVCVIAYEGATSAGGAEFISGINEGTLMLKKMYDKVD